MQPDDVRAAEAAAGEDYIWSLGSGSVLECSLCREIVKRLDRFVTNPTFIENASLLNIIYAVLVNYVFSLI